MNKTKVKLNTPNAKTINVYETFAGIGAQHKAITKNINNEKIFKVIKTSEWDARAIIAYAQIHNKEKFEQNLKTADSMSEKEINKYLFERTFSLNSKNPGDPIRKELSFKKNLFAANEANNNNPDITKVTGEQLEGVDLLTYSFPCQGLSVANMGRDQGIKEDANSTSNLIWQIWRILSDASNKSVQLPKYLLMENVKNLLSKKHLPDYKRWLEVLNGLGYTTATITLNARNHGALQKRERVFAISILNCDFEWNDDVLKKMVNESEMFTNLDLLKKESKDSFEQVKERNRTKFWAWITSSNFELDEIKDSIPKATPSRMKMANENIDLLDLERLEKNGYSINTQTTKQDRHPNVGMISLRKMLEFHNDASLPQYQLSEEVVKYITKIIKNYDKACKAGDFTGVLLDHRFLTTRESYMNMGFESMDFTKVKEKYKEKLISKEALYRQAGNSIVVNVLENIFEIIGEMEVTKNE